MGLDVDNDNAPVPENVPKATESVTGCTYGEWNSKHLCRWLSQGHIHESPKFMYDLYKKSLSHLMWFMYMPPMSFIRDIIIPATSENLDGKALTVEPSMWKGAPFWLSQHMTDYRFEHITNALTFTLTLPPTFRNKFHR
eukprot:6924609-Ditylum_brightwellii.AAC.1